MAYEEQNEPSPDEIIGEEQTKKIIGDAKRAVKPLINFGKGVLNAIVKEVKHLRQEIGFANKISYEEVMKYFIAHKDDSPAIVKGALLKEVDGENIIITQIFLDKGNNPVTGKFDKPLGYKKKIPLSGVDNELLHLFKDDDLIIVE